MESCDAIVVGGGPGGSTCAWRLRQAGLDVVVLDRAAFPRDKVCAGWLTPQVVDELELDVADYRHGRVFQPITGIRTGRLGGREIETRYGEPVSYGIRRCEFDHYLLARSGARVTVGPLDALERRGGDWVVNGAIRTPIVVGAGGHFCPVARRLGARPSGAGVVAAQEVEFVMDPRQQRACGVDGETPELYFSRDLRGYGWCFRKEAVLNVGLGRLDEHGLGAHVREFTRFLEARGKLPPGMPARWKGHAYAVYCDRSRPLLDDGVVLVGDAAGLAYPESGEGIRPAVESGLLAARAILDARGSYGRDALEPYALAVARHFGRRRSVDRGAAAARWVVQAGAAILAIPWLTRRLVVETWFLHRRLPALSWNPVMPAGARVGETLGASTG